MIQYRSTNRLVGIIAGLALLMTSGVGAASQTAESGFEATYHTQSEILSLSGVGVLTYLGFIRIYNGALYLPQDIKSKDALLDVSKRLEVEYLRSFKAEDFGTATISGMRKNVDPETFSRLEDQIDAHNQLYPDIQRGDRVSLTYIPSVGTEVAVNDTVKGTIPGAEFAKALFSLWLGDKPFDAGFKRALLGKR